MKLKELLDIIQTTSNTSDVSQPYLCGGAARDKYMGNLEKIADLDLTNGDKSISQLSLKLYDILSKKYNLTRKEMSDGHSSIFIGNMKLDFSSNYNTPGIDKILFNKNIKNPTEMQKEMFSRDFTCNALLLTLDIKTNIDPTYQGFKDIKNKKIQTCLDPQITLVSSRNRVARAIYLACKLDFDIDSKIVEFVSKNPQSIKISTNKSLNEKIEDAFEHDADKAVFYLTKMNLWDHIPISEKIYPYYLKHKAKTNG